MAKRKLKRLFHYTCTAHLQAILNSSFIKTTESNIKEDGSGTRVVWLTSNYRPPLSSWEQGSIVDKSEIRITVAISQKEIHHWPTWSRKQGISERWYSALASVGNPQEWYVVERPLYSEDIVKIQNTKTGKVIYEQETGFADGVIVG